MTNDINVLLRLGRPPQENSPEYPWSVETELERLKSRLLRRMLSAVASPALIPSIRRAANEAAALAWLEPYPLLAFPALFQEIALTSQRRFHKQMVVKSRSAELLAFAA